jgi:hypothetical protein
MAYKWDCGISGKVQSLQRQQVNDAALNFNQYQTKEENGNPHSTDREKNIFANHGAMAYPHCSSLKTKDE